MKRVAFVLAVTLLLSGCGNNPESVSDLENTTPVSDISDSTADIVSTVEAVSSVSGNTTSVPVSTYEAVSSASEITSVPEASSEPVSTYDLSDFNLSDYCGEFDPAKPMHYDAFDGLSLHELDPEIMELALGALKQSDIFAEVTAKAEELFTVQNGELIPTGESFLNEGYSEYISFSGGEGIAVNPRLAYNIKIGDEGHICAFSMPLAESLFEWSGTSTCIAVVYVSPDNKAQVLSEVSGQTLHDISVLRYTDETFHAVFQRGHTDGTARAFIVGFADGVPHIEYSGSVVRHDSSGTVLLETGYNVTMLLVKTAEHGWCYVGSVPLSEACAEILFSDDDVISACPDIAEKYEQGEVSVFGGKYIAAGGCYNDVYTLENGALVPCDFNHLIGANGMDESLEFRNINLN